MAIDISHNKNITPEYITIATRDNKLIVPTTIAQKSTVIKNWLERRNKNDEFFINRKHEEVNNLIDYMSDYDYKPTTALWEMIDEFIIDNKIMEEKIEKLKSTINKIETEYVVDYYVILDIPYFYVKKIANSIDDINKYYKCAILDKVTHHLIRFYKKNITPIKCNVMIYNSIYIVVNDIDIVEHVASVALQHYKYIYSYKDGDDYFLYWSNNDCYGLCRQNVQNFKYHKKYYEN